MVFQKHILSCCINKLTHPETLYRHVNSSLHRSPLHCFLNLFSLLLKILQGHSFSVKEWLRNYIILLAHETTLEKHQFKSIIVKLLILERTEKKAQQTLPGKLKHRSHAYICQPNSWNRSISCVEERNYYTYHLATQPDCNSIWRTWKINPIAKTAVKPRSMGQFHESIMYFCVVLINIQEQKLKHNDWTVEE